MKTSRFGTNRVLGLVLAVALGAFFLWVREEPGFDRRLMDGFSIGFFPSAAIALMIVFSVVLMFDSHRNAPATEGALVSWKILIAIAAIGAGGGVYVFLLPIVGFPILTPIYLAGLAFLLGMRPGIAMAVGVVAVTAVVYAVFWLLGFPLP